jgi:ribosomal protein L2
MALKHYNPTSPAQRGLILVDKSHLHKGKPVKALTEGKRKTGGRNNKGHVTSRGIAGGHKQRIASSISSAASGTWKARSSVWNMTPTAPRSSRWSSMRTASRPISSRRSASPWATR